MALPQHYLMALLTPFGRINQVGFAQLAILLGFMHLWVYYQLQLNQNLPAWNPYSIMLMAMLWMKFCILSRRMHDTGSAGFILVPILLLTAGLYLCAIDPESMGAQSWNSPELNYLLEHGMRIPRALLIAMFVYCVRVQGESGPNAYGPEFGETDDDRPLKDKKGFISLGTQPKHAYGLVLPKSTGKPWGERKRPKGFGRR
jgi:uncharacterized membrane protein YhaH (DUF805 family)